MLLFTCISRDNYWDPVNYAVIFQRNVHDSAIVRINSVSNVSKIKIDLSAQKNLLSSISLQNAQLENSDYLIRIENDRRRDTNNAIELKNAKLVPIDSTFRLKEPLTALFLFVTIPDTVSTLETFKVAVVLEKQRVDSIITMTNASTAVIIFPPRERDSILAGYTAIIRDIDSIIFIRDSMSTSIKNENVNVIKPYNDAVLLENRGIEIYNESIKSYLLAKPLDNKNDIVNNLKIAKPGQTIRIARGQYDSLAITFNNSGTIDSPIVVQGPDASVGDTTIFNVANVRLDKNSFITFNRIKFTAADTLGVLVQNGCTGIVFNTCQFTSSARGLTISTSDATLNDCIIKDGSEGMFISSPSGQSHTVLLYNVLIINTRGNGISITGTNLTVQYATIVRNGGEAIFLSIPALNLIVRNTIISNTGGTSNPAIYFDGGYTGASPLAMTNVNMVQNGANQDTVNAPVTAPILHYDPMFINEYDISPSSVLDSLEKAGTVIGYRRK